MSFFVMYLYEPFGYYKWESFAVLVLALLAGFIWSLRITVRSTLSALLVLASFAVLICYTQLQFYRHFTEASAWGIVLWWVLLDMRVCIAMFSVGAVAALLLTVFVRIDRNLRRRE